MAVKLTNFLAKLATEPDEYARFIKDPAGYMKKAGVSKAHQQLIKRKDSKKITAAVLKEQGHFLEQKGAIQGIVWVGCIYICVVLRGSDN
jgi:hypothetical protein